MSLENHPLETNKRLTDDQALYLTLTPSRKTPIIRPDLSPLHATGLAEIAAGRFAAGAEHLVQALGETPDNPTLLSHLGAVRLELGEIEGALAALRRAVALDPGFHGAQVNFGNALKMAGDLTGAAAAFHRALQIDPQDGYPAQALGGLLLDLNQPQAALAAAALATGLMPDSAEAWYGHGLALRRLGRLGDALASFTAAVKRDSSHAGALLNAANTLADMGRVGEAAPFYQAARQARPRDSRYAGAELSSLQYRDDIGPAELLAAHRAWARTLPPAEPMPPAPGRSGPLTVGIVSPDFGRHPIGWFLLPLLEGTDAARLRLILYSDRPVPQEDDISQRLFAAAKVRRIAGQSDPAVARQIRADGIEALIDASGHTAGNRLPLFARRAAPLQATWAGYTGTTGVPAMDAIIADPRQIPVGAESFYSERVIRLPDGYVPYMPPPDAPAIGPLPCGETAPLTFGSFNKLAKLSPRTLQRWARVLAAVPGSRLLLKFHGLEDATTAALLRQACGDAGIDPARLLLEGGGTHLDLLAAYNRVDIALDSTPYSGGLTTLEALWMGVPVLTVPGDTFASRHALAHLTAANRSEWAATDEAGMIAAAIALNHDRHHLAAVRAGMRDHLRAAPILDGRRFAEAFTAALLPLARPVS